MKHIVKSGLRVLPQFLLRNSRASETRARMKITPRKNRRHAAGREKNEGPSCFSLPAECRLLSRRVIFTRASVFLALLSLRTNRELLVVQVKSAFAIHPVYNVIVSRKNS